MKHARRPALAPLVAVHVTLRAGRGVPSFRAELPARVARGVFRELSPVPRPVPLTLTRTRPAPVERGEEAPAQGRWRLASPGNGKAARGKRGSDYARAAWAAVRRAAETREGKKRGFRRHPRATDRLAEGFHVVHYSLQRDHIHLIVEAESKAALSSGLRRLVIRLAKRINLQVRRRASGKVWGDRYHRRDLTTPREVRRALVYVLQNGCKHGEVARGTLDPLSSAIGFAGFAPDLRRQGARTVATPCTAPPIAWTLTTGWRRAGGPLRRDEVPRPP